MIVVASWARLDLMDCTCHAAEKRGEAGFGRFGDIFWDVMRLAARRRRRDDAVDWRGTSLRWVLGSA